MGQKRELESLSADITSVKKAIDEQKDGEFNVEDVTIVKAEIRRYLACNKCSKKVTQSSFNADTLECVNCDSGNTGAVEGHIQIRNIVLEKQDVEIQNVVCFNEDARKFLNSVMENRISLDSNEGLKNLPNLIGLKVNLDISVKYKQGDENYPVQIVASNINVLDCKQTKIIRMESRKQKSPNVVVVTVLEREWKQTKADSSKYYAYFLLWSGYPYKGRVEAKSFESDAETNYNKLKKGQTYVIEGDLRAEEKESKYISRSKPEIKLQYIFNEIKTTEMGNSDPGKEFGDEKATSIADAQKCIESMPSEDFKYRLVKGVILEAGEIFCYLGCKRCTKSNPEFRKDGYFKCTACKLRGTYEEIVKKCMIIVNMTIAEKCISKNAESSGVRITNIVCFNDAVEALMGKPCSDYASDQEAYADFKRLLASEINVRLSTQPSNPMFNSSKYDVVANHISIVRQNESFEDGVDAYPIGGHRVEGLKDGITSKKIDFKIKAAKTTETKRTKIMKSKMSYTHSTEPLGYALIINVAAYDNQELNKSRLWDFLKLYGLLSELKFKIFGNDPREPLNKEDLDSHIHNFKEELIAMDTASFIVIVIGHGYYQYLHLSNYERVNINECIIKPFAISTEQGKIDRFGLFKTRAKMFIFNLCQNYKEYTIRKPLVPFPNIESAYFTYSATEGHYSVRQTGSFFIEVLCKVFEEWASTEDYASLMNEVQVHMNKMKHPIWVDSKEEWVTPCQNDSKTFIKFRFSLEVVPEEKLKSDLSTVYKQVRQQLCVDENIGKEIQAMDQE